MGDTVGCQNPAQHRIGEAIPPYRSGMRAERVGAYRSAGWAVVCSLRQAAFDAYFLQICRLKRLLQIQHRQNRKFVDHAEKDGR